MNSVSIVKLLVTLYQTVKNLIAIESRKFFKSGRNVKPTATTNSQTPFQGLFTLFISKGNIALNQTSGIYFVTIWRDTGAAQTVLQHENIPYVSAALTALNVLLSGH